MIGGHNVVRSWRASVWLLLLASLAGCSSDNATTSERSTSYTVGGVVTGLSGSVTLTNNGGNRLILNTETAYIFSRTVAAGGTYQVAVDTQPTDQICTVSNGTGTANSTVSNVNVNCTTPPEYSVGGTVSGLSGSLILRNNGADDVALSTNGAYTFPAQLMSGSAYLVSVHDQPNNQACTVSNSAGTLSGNVANVNISCITDSWTHPANLTNNFTTSTLDPASTDQGVPQVAMDDSGNAVVVWAQSDGANVRIYRSDYNLTATAAWTHPVNLTNYISIAAGNAASPQVAMGRNGANDDVVIVWLQSGWLYMMERRAGTWAAPVIISQGGTSATSPRVAMDDQGNTVIVWSQKDAVGLAGIFQIFRSEYRSGAWTHPASLTDNISPDGTDALSPQVAMGRNVTDDDAVIVWRQRSGSIYRIYMSEYRGGGPWVNPAALTDSISPVGTGGQSGPQVAMDDSGNTIIVWDQANLEPQPHPYFPGPTSASVYQIFKREYRGGVWDTPTLGLLENFSPDGLHAINPKVAMDNLGNAIITWQQSDINDLQLFKSEYRLNAWTHPASLADNFSPDNEGVESHNLAMDNNGNAIIAWRQFDGLKSSAYKSEYRNSAWRHPVSLLDSYHPGTSASLSAGPYVVMDNSAPGDALIVWSQPDADTASAFQQTYVSEFR